MSQDVCFTNLAYVILQLTNLLILSEIFLCATDCNPGLTKVIPILRTDVIVFYRFEAGFQV